VSSEDLTKDEQTIILRQAQRAKKMALSGAKCTINQEWGEKGLEKMDFHAKYLFGDESETIKLKD
jgi:hypothetical protein